MGYRALLIDDDESVRFILRNALAQGGWQVTEIDDGCEAESALAARRYDLVVSDLYMPGMNGFEVLRRLRRYDAAGMPTWKTRADVPVLVVSGQAAEESLAFAARIGADACLSKPFDISEVQRIARELQGKPRSRAGRPRRSNSRS